MSKVLNKLLALSSAASQLKLLSRTWIIMLISTSFQASFDDLFVLKVLNKLLALSSAASQQKLLSGTWISMLISTSSFLKIIYTVTGKDVLPFIEQWVHQSGCARYLHFFFPIPLPPFNGGGVIVSFSMQLIWT